MAWTDNADNEAAFEIERSVTGSGGPFSPLVTVGANITAYTDANLASLTEYCYRVRAINAVEQAIILRLSRDDMEHHPQPLGVLKHDLPLR